MDFGCLLADPIMEDTVGKQLFFSSPRYGRFSLHSVRCDACAIRLNIAFFHVFWFPSNGIPIRQRAFFGRQIGSPKREHSKTVQNVQREKRTPNLSIPLSLVRRRLELPTIGPQDLVFRKIVPSSGNRSKSQQNFAIFRKKKMNRSNARSALWTFFCRRAKTPK